MTWAGFRNGRPPLRSSLCDRWPPLFLLLCCACHGGEPGLDAVGDCPAPLSEEALASLELSVNDFITLPPGASREMTLGQLECCFVLEPVDACVDWSVTPALVGAHIDGKSGLLTIDPEAASGSHYVVTAIVEGGRAVRSLDVYVVDSQQNPLIGARTEVAQLDCEGGSESLSDSGIGELYFRADGTYSVTWDPFETYKDYWGEYSFDLESGALSLSQTGGNYLPIDFDGEGQFRIDANADLILESIWMGSPMEAAKAPSCGYRFR